MNSLVNSYIPEEESIKKSRIYNGGFILEGLRVSTDLFNANIDTLIEIIDYTLTAVKEANTIALDRLHNPWEGGMKEWEKRFNLELELSNKADKLINILKEKLEIAFKYDYLLTTNLYKSSDDLGLIQQELINLLDMIRAYKESLPESLNQNTPFLL